VVIFNNTGKEREETLEFVRDCGDRWGVEIVWLEYRWKPGEHSFERVDFASASRKGEPFRQVILARGFLPNPVARFCTVELKIRTSNRYIRRLLGWEKYRNAVGLRADEPKRVVKLLHPRTVTVETTLFGDERTVKRGSGHSTGDSPVCPLAEAGVTNEDVLAFWRAQPFDLRLPADERTGKTLAGNCDLCFLKGAANITALIRENPEAADWWIETETLIPANHAGTARFRHDRPPYAELKRIALGMADEPGWLWADRGGMDCGEVVECNCTD
jgi:3'-phosphoadenosine 5'-phosphosulfate sulfotransferase (PAPS reductase)/FAD synthetase